MFDMILFVCPVVIGQGTRLFPDTGPARRQNPPAPCEPVDILRIRLAPISG